jgi:uncharacterized protein with ParB-like and HNH nuclease domain
MNINIENTARSVANLFFANNFDPNTGNLTCIGSGNIRIQKVIIPIYQRQYDWEKDELLRLLNNADEYIEGQSQNGNNSYFIGTVLLESKSDGKFELIDGQQRLTTTFLMNYVGYIISIHRYLNIPSATFTSKQRILEENSRLSQIQDFERRLFIERSTTPADFNEIFSEDFDSDDLNSEESDGLYTKIRNRLDFNYIFNCLDPKLYHENPHQRLMFIDAITKTKLNQDGTELNLLDNNEFNQRMHDTFSFLTKYFNSLYPSELNDKILGRSLKKIDSYLNSLTFCVLVSESPDDSFKLFEVLNSTGRTLTIIDKLKNYLYEKTVNVDKSLSADAFDKKWKTLTDLQDKMGKANITVDIARSELGTVKDKYYEYFSNKELFTSNIERRKLFKSESGSDFLERIIDSAEYLVRVYQSDCFDVKTKAHTLEWYAKIINRFGYDWGRQILLGSMILYKHLGSSDFFEGVDPIWNRNRIDENDTLNSCTNLDKFYSTLFDVTTKIGVLGIINGLSSNKLPEVSKSILLKIIEFVESEKTQDDLGKLKNEILLLFGDFLSHHSNDFTSNLRKLRYSHSGDRKHMTTLLFILYNKGKGVSYEFKNPSLEHFESKTRPSGVTDGYYNGEDRDDILNSFGNLILMKAKLNSQLGNSPIKVKIDKINREQSFKNEVFFTHDIFKNLDVEKQISGNTQIYSSFPKNTLGGTYTDEYVPTKDFFEGRTQFYIHNIHNMICNNKNFLLSGDTYPSM